MVYYCDLEKCVTGTRRRGPPPFLSVSLEKAYRFMACPKLVCVFADSICSVIPENKVAY